MYFDSPGGAARFYGFHDNAGAFAEFELSEHSLVILCHCNYDFGKSLKSEMIRDDYTP